jgi:hypothetical protein
MLGNGVGGMVTDSPTALDLGTITPVATAPATTAATNMTFVLVDAPDIVLVTVAPTPPPPAAAAAATLAVPADTAPAADAVFCAD